MGGLDQQAHEEQRVRVQLLRHAREAVSTKKNCMKATGKAFPRREAADVAADIHSRTSARTDTRQKQQRMQQYAKEHMTTTANVGKSGVSLSANRRSLPRRAYIYISTHAQLR